MGQLGLPAAAILNCAPSLLRLSLYRFVGYSAVFFSCSLFFFGFFVGYQALLSWCPSVPQRGLGPASPNAMNANFVGEKIFRCAKRVFRMGFFQHFTAAGCSAKTACGFLFLCIARTPSKGWRCEHNMQPYAGWAVMVASLQRNPYYS